MTRRRAQDWRTGRPSNRLSHGLRSRLIKKSPDDDADALAAEILAGLPRNAEISSLARDLADAILHLGAIRRARRELLAPPPEGDHLEDQPDEDDARPRHCRVSDSLTDNGEALRRMGEYERKAISRRNGLIRRLDDLTIEIRRQNVG